MSFSRACSSNWTRSLCTNIDAQTRVCAQIHTSTYGARPVLVVRCLSYGSYNVYIIPIATDDVTERIIYIPRHYTWTWTSRYTPSGLSDPFKCEQTNDHVAVCCYSYSASHKLRANWTWQCLCDVTTLWRHDSVDVSLVRLIMAYICNALDWMLLPKSLTVFNGVKAVKRKCQQSLVET